MKLEDVLKRAESLCHDKDKHALFWLLLEVFNITATTYFLTSKEEASKDKTKDYFDKANKYISSNIPVQYIMGYTYFYGNRIKVNENTLIPRNETELLVKKTLEYIKSYFSEKEEIKVLDLATGTGVIGLTIKLINPKYDVTVSDISEKALLVAKENISDYKVEIKIINSDWFLNIKDKYDVIISNPPYIKTSYKVPKIVDKEPSLALYSGEFGTSSYEEILKNINNHLNDKAIVAFEHGYDQKESIAYLVKKHLKGVKIVQEKDLNEKDRYTFILM